MESNHDRTGDAPLPGSQDATAESGSEGPSILGESPVEGRPSLGTASGATAGDDATRSAGTARGTAGSARRARGVGSRGSGRATERDDAGAGSGGFSRTSERLHSAAERLGRMADERFGETAGRGRLRSAAHATEGALGSVAGYLREPDLDAVRDSLERQVRQRPLQSLLIAVAAGWLAGKILR